MDSYSDTLLEILKVVATIAIPYIGLLKTRTELDRFAASQRAKECGGDYEGQIRKRWYHRAFREKKKRGAK